MKVWIDAKGFPGYEVSNESDVRNKKTGRLLHQCNLKFGLSKLGKHTIPFANVNEKLALIIPQCPNVFRENKITIKDFILKK